MAPIPSPLMEKARFTVLWIIWAVLLMGELGFLGVVAYLAQQNAQGHGQNLPAGTLTLLIGVNVGMLVVLTPIGFLLRRVIGSRARKAEGFVPIRVYSTCCIISWACCEGPVFFSLAIVFISHIFWPAILIAAIGMAVQILSFPRAAAVRKAPETFQMQ